MGRTTEKFTYTDGSYFCNICDSPHEGEELAEDCYDTHPKRLDIRLADANDNTVEEHGDMKRAKAVKLALRFVKAQLGEGLGGSVSWCPSEAE